jgi:putative endonuclease
MKPLYKRMLAGMAAKEAAQPAQRTKKKAVPKPAWFLYILECGDGTLYTGVTTDITRRVREHQEGKGARYTRTHAPVSLVHEEPCGSRSQALSRECAIKALPRRKKHELIGGTPEKVKAAPPRAAHPGRRRGRV